MRVLAFICAFLLCASFGFARNIQTLDGKLFKDATVTKVEKLGIRITHESGVAFIDFKNLPLELKKEFGFSEEAYVAGTIEKDALSAEVVALQKATAEAKQAQLELEKAKRDALAAQIAALAAQTAKKQEPIKSEEFESTALNNGYATRSYETTTYSAPRYSDTSTYSPSSSDVVHVKGYYRKNGTYVQPHTRSKPRR